MNRSAKCTAAYNDVISTYGRFPLEDIRQEKQRRGYGDSSEFYGSGFSNTQVKEMVLASFASREQARCNENPASYSMYGGKRKSTRRRKTKRKSKGRVPRPV
jgi:hypothetical protein